MVLRLRGAEARRDGLERVQLPDGATLGDLRRAIQEQLGVITGEQVLSKEQGLLTAKEEDCATFQDLGGSDSAALEALGVRHGEQLFLRYFFDREVASGVPRSAREAKSFGAKMTMDELIALQTRIDRQEVPHCQALSLDRHAANMFQMYLSQGLGFSVKRGALMYGVVEEGGQVRADAIYEPPQEASAEALTLLEAPEEQRLADTVALSLGLTRVGWIFSQAGGERNFLLSTAEVVDMGRMQAGAGEKTTFVSGVVSLTHSEEGSSVHFEAYQVSDQCQDLVQRGWFQRSPMGTGVSEMWNPEEPGDKTPVVVAGLDATKVDNEWFLCPVKILDHGGPLRSDFPIENRLTPQGLSELRSYLQAERGRPLKETLADFHLLLFLAKERHLDLDDVVRVGEAIRAGDDVQEGYRLILESVAGL